MKPKIRKRGKFWYCSCCHAMAAGMTYGEAYQRWFHMTAHYQ